MIFCIKIQLEVKCFIQNSPRIQFHASFSVEIDDIEKIQVFFCILKMQNSENPFCHSLS